MYRLLPFLLTCAAAAWAWPGVIHDGTPQARFAAAEFTRLHGAAVPEFPLSALNSAGCSPCFVIAHGEEALRVAREFKTAPPRSAGREAYALRRAANGYFLALGADPTGAMYGGLDLAEAFSLNALSEFRDTDHAPHIERRGIKFNVPLDARTPSYSDNSDAAQFNIAEMWSLDFWREFLDHLARHRYNLLSLWNLHPFPSFVKVPEFPEVALDDVMRTTHPLDETFSHRATDMVRPAMLASLETLRTMTIEDKIAHWREVMEMAHARGIEVYLFTWNLYTFGAEGKYGITADQTNPRTTEYFRASIRELVLTYPRLAGLGITAGENLRDLPSPHSKEEWLWNTYGEGVRDALKKTPGREVRMIHRYHETKPGEIETAWKHYPGPFELSYKYSVAHMHSIAGPPFINKTLETLPGGRRLFLTVRDDDIYSFRWGNPDYARAYIKAMPPRSQLAGFYMGPDGTIWGREVAAQHPKSPRETVIAKRWYSFLLWGRLSYDPDLQDEWIARLVARRFPGAGTEALRRAWHESSMVFPLITRFFWGDIDLKWFPEACLSHPRYRGYYTVKHFMDGGTMPGSGVMNIRDYVGGKGQGQTPLEIAAQLESGAAAALDPLPALRAQARGSSELAATLLDIEAMAWLGRYYAAKIRGAVALAEFHRSGDELKRAQAIQHLESAVQHWRQYSAAYTAQYLPKQLYNRVGFVDIPGLLANAYHDIEIARTWKPDVQ
ncbi:MAG: hypothetical protein KJZ84_10900 [Bryobacteraceae bacterium]|nr:hypothetical protein [Bryobacteraceae bacterium]